MKRMRWQVIVLVLWLTLLFNIERLDFDGVVTVNLASYFYIMIAATVVLFLFVPFRRIQMYLASFGVLSIYTVVGVLEPAISFTGDVDKYLRITEIVALLTTIGLTWLVSQTLQDFMEAVEAISLPEGGPRLLSLGKFHERIRAEIGRARRHQHPMSVSMIELNPSTFEASLHQAVRDAQAAMTKRYVQVRFGVFLAKQIRETDVIASYKDGRFLILAPQVTAAQMKAMLKRLEHDVVRQTDLRFRYSTADFPNAALTSEELIGKVAEDLQIQGMVHDDYQNGNQSKPVVAAKESDTNETTSSRRVDSLDEIVTTQMKTNNHEAGNGAQYQNGR